MRITNAEKIKSKLVKIQERSGETKDKLGTIPRDLDAANAALDRVVSQLSQMKNSRLSKVQSELEGYMTAIVECKNSLRRIVYSK